MIWKPGASTNHQIWCWFHIRDHPLEHAQRWWFSIVGTLCRFQYSGHFLPWECYITCICKTAWALKRSTHHLWVSFSPCLPPLLLNFPLRLLVLYLRMIGCENPSFSLPMNSESKCNKPTDGWSRWEASHSPRTRIARAMTGSACFAIVSSRVSRNRCCERRIIRTRDRDTASRPEQGGNLTINV